MIVTVTTADLTNALADVARAVERGSTIPILTHVLLTAEAGRLTLHGTNLEIGITSLIEAEVEQDGTLALPCATLAQIVKSPMAATTTQITTQEQDQVRIWSGRARSTLSYLPAEDFPLWALSGDAGFEAEIPGAAFKRMLSTTLASVSTDEARYYLNGVYLECPAEEGTGADTTLRATATNGHHLTHARSTLTPEGLTGAPSVIIPNRTVSALIAMIRDAPIELALTESRIEVRQDDRRLASKVIDGTFPAYDRVIPKGNDGITVVSAAQLAAAAGNLADLARSSQTTGAVRLRQTPEGLSLSTAASALSSEATIDAETTGDPIESGISPRYLRAVAEHFAPERVRLVFTGEGSPIRFESPEAAQKEEIEITSVVMPMRV